MKVSLNIEADAINVLALNMGRIAVDIDGIELAELIDVVNQNGYSLHVADEPGKLAVEDPLPPVTRLNGIQCSTAHISEADNNLLFALSHQHEDFGDSEWISGLAPIFPDTFYRLTHYWFSAADIPVANDIPVHCADAIRCNVRRPPQGSLPLLTRQVLA
ncbi:Uncharacterised protein [Serratia marcescens]|nr:Uncharacterised protein [Serratia marcescens]